MPTIDSGRSLGIAILPGLVGTSTGAAGACGSGGGSVLIIGEASGPSGGGSGIFAGENGWHVANNKAAIRPGSNAMVVGRSIVFIGTSKISYFCCMSLSNL
jgi:hypothetical protein